MLMVNHLAQCHDWIANNLPNAEKITVLSNAEGAKIASKEKHSAAIASARAASIFKLNYYKIILKMNQTIPQGS